MAILKFCGPLQKYVCSWKKNPLVIYSVLVLIVGISSLIDHWVCRLLSNQNGRSLHPLHWSTPGIARAGALVLCWPWTQSRRRAHIAGSQALLIWSPLSLLKLFGCSLISIASLLIRRESFKSYKKALRMWLRGAMSEISNLYNFSPRFFIFGTHIPPILTI